MAEPTMNCFEVNELAGAYATGALPPERVKEVERHLDGCGVRQEFAALSAAAAALLLAVPEVTPPPELRSRVIAGDGGAAAAGTEEARQPDSAGSEQARLVRAPTEPDTPAAPQPEEAEEPGRGPLLPIAGGLAKGVAAVARAARDATDRGPSAPEPPAAGLPPLSVHQSTAEALYDSRLVEIPGERLAILTVYGLEPPPPDRTRQVWLTRNEATRSVGFLPPTADSTVSLALDLPLRPGDELIVTIEPEGGSARPSGDPIAVNRS
jgi:anti-sigma-K factor RskA